MIKMFGGQELPVKSATYEREPDHQKRSPLETH
jgi:hypothetical protein